MHSGAKKINFATTNTTNKKCKNCLKVSKISLDNGIPLPSQSCPNCGFENF